MKKKNVFKCIFACSAVLLGCSATVPYLNTQAKSHKYKHHIVRIYRHHARKYHYSYNTLYKHILNTHTERRYQSRDIQSIIYGLNHHKFSRYQRTEFELVMRWYNKHPRYHIHFTHSLITRTQYHISAIVRHKRHKYIKRSTHTKYSYAIPKRELTLYARRNHSRYHFIFNGTPRRKTDNEWNNFGGANNRTAAIFRNSLISSINKFRHHYHLKPYVFSPWLQQIANKRAKEVNKAYQTEPASYSEEQRQGNPQQSDNWIHGMDEHETSTDIAHKLRYSQYVHYNYSHRNNYYQVVSNENAGPIYTGKSVPGTDLGYYYTDNNTQPARTAHNITYDMIHHDNYSQNGHTQNLLSNDTKYMGVSVYFYGKFQPNYNQKIQGSLVEEFA